MICWKGDTLIANNAQEPGRIPIEEAKSRLDEGDEVILDVIDPGAFE